LQALAHSHCTIAGETVRFGRLEPKKPGAPEAMKCALSLLMAARSPQVQLPVEYFPQANEHR